MKKVPKKCGVCGGKDIKAVKLSDGSYAGECMNPDCGLKRALGDLNATL